MPRKLYVISCLENCILRKLDLSRLALLMNPVPNHYQLLFLYNFVQRVHNFAFIIAEGIHFKYLGIKGLKEPKFVNRKMA